MKKLFALTIFLLSIKSLACNVTILEQDGKYFLAIKKVGELPSEDEVPEKKLRRGLQEIEVSKKKKEDSTEESKSRKSRFKIIYDSEDRDVIERMLKTRCPN